IAEVKKRGATITQPPQVFKDATGQWRFASIRGYGETLFGFVDRSGYRGDFAPGFVAYSAPAAKKTGLAAIDHMVGNVQLGAMNHWVDFFAKVLGFEQLCHFSDDDISTEYSALMSKVMQNGTGKIKFPINEPADGKKKSQIEEYLDFYRGPGVQ